VAAARVAPGSSVAAVVGCSPAVLVVPSLFSFMPALLRRFFLVATFGHDMRTHSPKKKFTSQR
jgi:hypothetical protein